MLPVVAELPNGTRDEMGTVEEWENDKELYQGTRRNKYWPVSTSTLWLDSLVHFEGRCVAWGELQTEGFCLESSYPVAFVVKASDPFMYANDLGHANNIAWIPHLQRSDDDPATLRRSYHMFDPASRSSGGGLSYYNSVDAFEDMTGQLMEVGFSELSLYYPVVAEQVPVFERIAQDVLPRLRVSELI